MGPHSEGTESLARVQALDDPRVLACLGVWLAAISVGMTALWFTAEPVHDPVAQVSSTHKP
jgi:hypothetical protein